MVLSSDITMSVYLASQENFDFVQDMLASPAAMEEFGSLCGVSYSEWVRSKYSTPMGVCDTCKPFLQHILYSSNTQVTIQDFIDRFTYEYYHVAPLVLRLKQQCGIPVPTCPSPTHTSSPIPTRVTDTCPTLVSSPVVPVPVPISSPTIPTISAPTSHPAPVPEKFQYQNFISSIEKSNFRMNMNFRKLLTSTENITMFGVITGFDFIDWGKSRVASTFFSVRASEYICDSKHGGLHGRDIRLLRDQLYASGDDAMISIGHIFNDYISSV